MKFYSYDSDFAVKVNNNNSKHGKHNHEGSFAFPANKIVKVLIIYDGYLERLILKNDEGSKNFIVLSLIDKKVNEGVWCIGVYFWDENPKNYCKIVEL